jgi:polar amino acid transport system substrate-binding protein
MRNMTRATALAAVLAVTLTAAGCSSDDSASEGAESSAPAVTITTDDALAAMVPSGIASDGTLLVGTDASYAPNEFLDADGKTILGWDIDLATAVAQVLGLKAEFENAPFDTLVSGVKSGKYDLGVSSFSINPERMQQVDMPSYFNAGTAWAVPTGNPENITPDTACGFKVAVQKGTVQVEDITARSEKCTDAGDQAITIEQYQLQSDATAAVVSGKDDAMLSDSPIIDYAIAQTGDKLTKTGEIYDAAPYGYAVPKEGDYAKALQGAVQKLMDDGEYLRILTEWGVQDGAITTSELNPS